MTVILLSIALAVSVAANVLGAWYILYVHRCINAGFDAIASAFKDE